MWGILITAVVIISLVLVARSAIKACEAEVRKQPDSGGPDSALDPSLLTTDSGFSDDPPQHHGIHYSDPGCVDSHHGGCDPGGHARFDARAWAIQVGITSGAGGGTRTP